jgi:hypothetical protein
MVGTEGKYQDKQGIQGYNPEYMLQEYKGSI